MILLLHFGAHMAYSLTYFNTMSNQWGDIATLCTMFARWRACIPIYLPDSPGPFPSGRTYASQLGANAETRKRFERANVVQWVSFQIVQ